MRRLVLLLAVFLCLGEAYAQRYENVLREHLPSQLHDRGLTPTDLEEWVVSDYVVSKHNGAEHVYLQQTHENIPVYNALTKATLKDGKVWDVSSRFVRNLSNRINTTTPQLSPSDAVQAAARQLGLPYVGSLAARTSPKTKGYSLSNATLSSEDIPVRLMYQEVDGETVRLAWDLSILTPHGQHWWSVRVDAVTGDLLDRADWMAHCNFGGSHTAHDHQPARRQLATAAATGEGNYVVYPIPVESPNHGSRTRVEDPADTEASPFGWHDVSGTSTPDFTITRGNNVYAYEDQDADNVPGRSPDGGDSLVFDFPIDFSQNPDAYEDAAITNLFFWNNLMHDVWYRYGFDELSGNFQENNYDRGGEDGDGVFAEAQDGEDLNNANFGTPPDGGNPRMQMFLWNRGADLRELLTINGTGNLAGGYLATSATFGPGLPQSDLTEDLVLITDASGPDPQDGCDAILNGSDVDGKIGVVRRGNCSFVAKVEALQAEGAVAVVVVNDESVAPIPMGGNSTNVTIPAIMIFQAQGEALISALEAGEVLNGTIPTSAGSILTDGDFDNVIIAHEYGHGISNRLTGGPAAAGCLQNDEQMGEGWSDFFGLMLTIEPGDEGTDVRGVGTFAIGQDTEGRGIRPTAYTTNRSINNATYATANDVNNISQPHGVGYVWATMLWDLNWALIDEYGFDADLYNGTGGNNICMQLVIDGLKEQPCNPGFVDGRDAILRADSLTFGGANQKLIWEVFAARGLGAEADQGSSNSRSDQSESFEVPLIFQTAITAPTAGFQSLSSQACSAAFQFEDASVDIPQAWSWDFGDGANSTLQSPSHTYTASGTYTVRLIASNPLGSDTSTQTVVVDLLEPPTIFSSTTCVDSSATLTGTPDDGAVLEWLDQDGQVVFTGNTFVTPPLDAPQVYTARSAIRFPSAQVGPANGDFAGGSYHGTTFTGTVNFEASEAITIVSVFVDAEGTRRRELFLWEGENGTGQVLQRFNDVIPDGQSRIKLNFEVPGPGSYSIGGTGVDLFRNNEGAQYPYELDNMITLTGSSAGEDFYYYLYDLEVQSAACLSSIEPVLADVVDVNFGFETNDLMVSFFDSSTTTTQEYGWDFGDGNTSTDQNPVHTYAAAGTYTVSLTLDGFACTVVQNVTVGTTSAQETLPNGASVALLPNPAADLATLRLSKHTATDVTVEVQAADGRVLSRQILPAGATQLDLPVEAFPDAVYLVVVRTADAVVTKRLVVSH